MSLLLVAYPELSNTDFELIQDYRKAHDTLYYAIVEPHFTLVFPVENFSEEVFIQEISSLTKQVKSIPFSLRCATVSKDAFKHYYHLFLVPDEGYSRIVKLHDLVYSQALKEHHRLDIDFVPHIGIANAPEASVSKMMADEWNSEMFEISGKISKLSILRYENNSVNTIHEIKLQEN